MPTELAPGQVEAQVDLDVHEEVRRVVPEGFGVHDAESAAWVVRRVVEARQYAQRVRVWAEVEQRRAEAEEKRLMFLFENQLLAWTEGELRKLKGRRKSISLPGGTVGFRACKASVVIEDEQTVLGWAKANCPSAVVISQRLLKSVLNDHIATTGEIPDAGVRVQEAREVFFIR